MKRPVHTHTHRLIHYLVLSYDRYTASSKANSPQSAIQCLLFFLISCTPSFRKVTQQLFISSSSSSRHFHPSFYISLNNAFQKAVPSQHVTDAVCLPSFYCIQDIPRLFDSLHYFYISHMFGPPYSKTFKAFLTYFPKCLSFNIHMYEYTYINTHTHTNKKNNNNQVCMYVHISCGPGSSVGIATDYGLDGSGSNAGGDEIFRPS